MLGIFSAGAGLTESVIGPELADVADWREDNRRDRRSSEQAPLERPVVDPGQASLHRRQLPPMGFDEIARPDRQGP